MGEDGSWLSWITEFPYTVTPCSYLRREGPYFSTPPQYYVRYAAADRGYGYMFYIHDSD